MLYNGLGHYDAALAAAQQACEHDDLGLFGSALIELVEAGARSGAHEVAASALRSLEQRTHAAGTDWALGIEARSRALLSDGHNAESLYLEAIDRLGRTRIVVHLARARLVYGEWLRRENRRSRRARAAARGPRDAQQHRGRGVRRACPSRADGDRRDRAEAHDRDRATCSPHKSHRSRALRHEGHTNPEIGAQLFISPRTVEYHLAKVFTKLGINSRRELRRAAPVVFPG